MFAGKSVFAIIWMGGWPFWILIGASVLSIAVIILKLMEFKNKSKVTRKTFINQILEKLRKKNVDGAINLCDNTLSPMAPVVKAGLDAYSSKEGTPGEAMDREIKIQTIILEKYTTIIGTIGSIAVYIGLLGTVIGIIKSFKNIAQVGSGGISVVIGGVSESLIATAAGLAVAIPAVIAYNFLSKTIDNFVVDMEYSASAVEDFISGK
ncbi:MotA/TolQ/ExbB proton channel family protein [Endomicrobium proavitum]|uniref:Putative Transporter, MotA/TolQ/ExbB proton channel family protein n=1 Tax=Endomicrobium proavitum TaxID=1408281 RepID=A0A0G3WHK7_9BACT|nr:MotA/TolQ/ExbB proton channel family protein [Endomicrobium proavitum]AKL98121.1 putative Transporter, MotA/TolQ/ExbB proton channel family protein [Endomicrobium proavitum]